MIAHAVNIQAVAQVEPDPVGSPAQRLEIGHHRSRDEMLGRIETQDQPVKGDVEIRGRWQ
ncbi:MAG: hypothetical protein PHN30_10365 [Bacteroidales bacterium]|nr:hypothetical protein [Bacteroidales bacterium]